MGHMAPKCATAIPGTSQIQNIRIRKQVTVPLCTNRASYHNACIFIWENFSINIIQYMQPVENLVMQSGYWV